MRASGDPKFLAQGRWGRMVAMMDGTFRMLSTGASWSGNERNHLFLGSPGGSEFTRLSGISGLDDPGDSMAAALLDFDRDGWMDVALGNIGQPRFRLLRNNVRERLERPHGFVALRLVGGNDLAEPRPGWSARDALGARVEVDLGGGRRIVREHRRNDGFKTQHTGTLLIGIGRAANVDVEGTWPSGRELSVTDIADGTLVTLYENEAHSPSGEHVVRESYVPEPADELLIDGVHGDSGLTVYVTMSTSCTSCVRAMPDLYALRQTLGEKELTLVGIPVHDEDSVEALQEYAESRQPPYALQIGLPEETVGRVREVVAARLHADGSSTPASIVTNSSGTILAARWGVPTLSELRRLQAAEGE